MYITYKYKLYQNSKANILHRYIDDAAIVYNHFIMFHKHYYGLFKKQVHKYALQKFVTKLKNRAQKLLVNGKELPYFYQVLLTMNVSSISTITEKIDRSYKLFYTNLKKGIPCSPPKRYSNISKYPSVTFKNGFALVDNNIVRIMNNNYKFFKDRLFTGKPKLLTVKRDPLGELYIYFVVDIDIQIQKNNCAEDVEIRINLNRFISIMPSRNENSLQYNPNGNNSVIDSYFDIDFNEPVKRALRRLSEAQKIWEHRKASNTKIESFRKPTTAEAKESLKKELEAQSEKDLMNLRRAYRKVVRCRNDYYYKLALDLVRRYKTITFMDNSEELKVNEANNIALHNNGYFNFINILKWQAYKHDANVIIHKITVTPEEFK